MWTAGERQQYAWTRRKEGLRLTDREWTLLEPLLPEHREPDNCYTALLPGIGPSVARV
jgi:hypothetical protein